MLAMRNSVYASTARFDSSARALTEDEMHRKAPAIFATAPHESRSERFHAIATIDILRKLQAEGFSPVGVKQSKTRDESRLSHCKHLIRLRRLDDATEYKVGDNVLEIILKNANDGSCSYELMAGMFRIRCTNSLVSQTSTLDSIRVRHSGNAQLIQDNVIEGTYTVLNETKKLLAAPELWGALKLDRHERIGLATGAHHARFADSEGEITTPIKPEQLLVPMRYDDRGEDLWTTFNVVQERTIKGGLKGVVRGDDGRTRRVTTRGVTGVDQDVKLNKSLWVMAAAIAKSRGLPDIG
jgi:hypothetical protein